MNVCRTLLGRGCSVEVQSFTRDSSWTASKNKVIPLLDSIVLVSASFFEVRRFSSMLLRVTSLTMNVYALNSSSNPSKSNPRSPVKIRTSTSSVGSTSSPNNKSASHSFPTHVPDIQTHFRSHSPNISPEIACEDTNVGLNLSLSVVSSETCILDSTTLLENDKSFAAGFSADT